MKARKGFTLIELLIVVAIIGILAAIAIPNLMTAQRRSRYSKAASDTKTATSQTVIYSSDTGRYPTTMTALRVGGYANVADNDPWTEPYVLATLLTSGGIPAISDDVYIYSKGGSRTGVYPVPFSGDTGSNGSVGFSSVYGSWSGS